MKPKRAHLKRAATGKGRTKGGIAKTRPKRAALSKSTKAALERGRRNEVKALKDLKLKSNRTKFTHTDKKTGEVIKMRPDAIRRSGQPVKIKDTKTVSLSR